jgi:hypothetical protein
MALGWSRDASAQQVVSFTLINADTDQPVPGFDPIADGATLSLPTLPTTNLNVRANTSSGVGSVRFALDGNSNFRVESSAPYALAGDTAGDYYPWTPSTGSHTLTATPYTGGGATGAAGTARTITFTVTTATGGTSGSAVTSFTLVNADTDQPVPGFDPMPNGATLNLATLPTRNLNVRANTSPAAVGSVRFGLDGNPSFRTENLPPYALAADDMAGDYYAWTPAVGSHTLTATPYAGGGATGTAGTPLTIAFTVTDAAGGQGTPSGPAVASLTLLNADTNQPVAGFDPIPNGATLNLATLPTRNLNIRANTSPATVGSVRFGLDGNPSFRTENLAPYALAGDNMAGDYYAWTPANGSHTLTVTAYTGSSATGTAGAPLVLAFTVTDAAASTPDLAVPSVSLGAASVVPGGSVVVTAQVANQGTASAGASTLGLYLASSPTASLSQATNLGSAAVGSLTAGGSTTIVQSVTIPSSASGTQYVIAQADVSGAVSEVNEGNNRGSQPLQVGSGTASFPVWVVDGVTRVQRSDPVGAVTAITLEGARNEYLSVQLVVRGPLSGVNVTVSDLVGPGTIPSSSVKRFRAQWITVSNRSDFGSWQAPYAPGDWADALVPFEVPGGQYASAPFSVPSGSNQVVWLDVFVPKGTTPGTYQGTVTVTASGKTPVLVPLTLTVWRITLPDSPRLQSDLGIYDTWFIIAAQTVGANQAALHSNLRSSLTQHRLSVNPFDTCYFDEPPYGSSYSAIYSAASGCRNQGKPVVVTIQNGEAWDVLVGYVDIWVPVHYMMTSIASEIPQRIAQGQTVWSYTTGLQGEAPNWKIDFGLIHYRIVPWFDYRHGMKGLLYWTTAWWEAGDPWTNDDAVNGEGVLFYPGGPVGARDAAIPSARLKALRDGMQDYDYLSLLAQLGDPGRASQLAASVAPNWSTWSRDPAVLKAARSQAAARILQLGGN